MRLMLNDVDQETLRVNTYIDSCEDLVIEIEGIIVMWFDRKSLKFCSMILSDDDKYTLSKLGVEINHERNTVNVSF